MARGRTAMVRTRVVALVCAAAVWGCDSKARPMRDAQAAAAGAGARAAVSRIVVEAFDAKRITIGDMIDLAASRLEAEEAKPGGAAASQAAAALAGGVLDAASVVASKLPAGGEFELFWMKMGRLAFRSADEALANGRLEEAESLMLAGPARWQNEAYWVRYPDHDALVAVVLAQRGKRDEALRRLGSRPHLTGLAAEVYERLRGR